MQTTYGVSARRADRVLGLSRSARHYLPRPREDGPLIEAMLTHVAANPGHGFGLLHACALKPHGWGKTRSWRVYTALKLNLPRRGKRRLPARIRDPLEVPATPMATTSPRTTSSRPSGRTVAAWPTSTSGRSATLTVVATS